MYELRQHSLIHKSYNLLLMHTSWIGHSECCSIYTIFFCLRLEDDHKRTITKGRSQISFPLRSSTLFEVSMYFLGLNRMAIKIYKDDVACVFKRHSGANLVPDATRNDAIQTC